MQVKVQKYIWGKIMISKNEAENIKKFNKNFVVLLFSNSSSSLGESVLGLDPIIPRGFR